MAGPKVLWGQQWGRVSPSLPLIQAGKAPGLAAPGWGHLRHWSGTEGPIVQSPPKAHKGQRPTKAGWAFHLSSQTDWPFSWLGAAGQGGIVGGGGATNPSKPGVHVVKDGVG